MPHLLQLFIISSSQKPTEFGISHVKQFTNDLMREFFSFPTHFQPGEEKGSKTVREERERKK